MYKVVPCGNQMTNWYSTFYQHQGTDNVFVQVFYRRTDKNT